MGDLDPLLVAGRPNDALTADVVRQRMRAELFGASEPSSAAPRYTILERLGAGGMGTVWAAWDSTLDRKVALKLLRPELGDDPAVERARIVREAQALARLSHPNVVAVYDVTAWSPSDAPTREYILLAMEFVAGDTLDVWCRRGRTVPQILDVYTQAARGLAAAHRAGVVHADFKPGNVIVDPEGRARVLDFGLARLEDRTSATPSEASGAAASSPAAFAGTPRYMAPEQHHGAALDPRADQYALCVSLWEAVTGAPPFCGANTAALSLAKDAGPPAQPSGMPRWLYRALSRGLAVEPAARHAEMLALVDALADPATRRRRRSLLIAAGTIALAFAAWPRSDACDGGVAHMSDRWDPGRAEAIALAFHASPLDYADTSWRTAAEVLDRWRDGWVASWRAACESHRRGEISGELLDLRMSCLDHRLLGFDAAVDTLAAADRGAVEHAVEIASGLPGLERCQDAEALRAILPRPDDPDARTTIAGLEARLAIVRAELDAGLHTRAAEAATAIVAEARGLARPYPPLEAEALLVLADAESWRGRGDAARASWRDAAVVAARVRADETFVLATAGLVWELAEGGASHERIDDWSALAEARLADLGDAPDAAFALHNARGVAWSSGPRSDDAVAEFTAGLALVERTWGAADLRNATLHANLGNLELRRNRLTAALEHHRRALEIGTTALGREHPRVRMSRYNLAVLLVELAREDDALHELEALLAGASAARDGVSDKDLGWIHATVAMALANLHRGRAARDHADTALELLALGPENAHARIVALVARGYGRLHDGSTDAGRFDAAEQDGHSAMAALEANPTLRPVTEAAALLLLANVAHARRDGGDVEPLYLHAWSRALAMGNPSDASQALTSLSMLELERGRVDLAIWWASAGLLGAPQTQLGQRRRANAHARMALALLGAGATETAAQQIELAKHWFPAPAAAESQTERVVAEARLELALGHRDRAGALVRGQRERIAEDADFPELDTLIASLAP